MSQTARPVSKPTRRTRVAEIERTANGQSAAVQSRIEAGSMVGSRSTNDTPAARLLRRDGRHPSFIAFEEAVLTYCIDAAEMLAVPKSLAAIYGVCFASPVPLSFSEITERLDISSGSISQGLHVLREIGALRVTPSDTDRQDRYTPDFEMRRLVSHFIDNRLSRQLDASGGTLRTISLRIPRASSMSSVLTARVDTLSKWHDQTRAMLPLIKTFLKLT